MAKEENAIILDFLPYGYVMEQKMMPIAQAIGTSGFTLLQLVPRRGEKFEVGDLKLDASKREVKAKNKVVQLTIREFDLLHYLIKNSNRIVSKEEILEKVWGGGDSLMLSETVEVHISSIRKKVGKKHIETIRGAGYIIKSV